MARLTPVAHKPWLLKPPMPIAAEWPACASRRIAGVTWMPPAPVVDWAGPLPVTPPVPPALPEPWVPPPRVPPDSKLEVPLWPGMRRVLPAMMRFGLAMLFARASAETVVLKREASAERVSPD
jgi:hypothetical protein